MTYYTILTALGASVLTNAYVSGTSIELTHLALGDGDGSAVTPTEGMTALVHEVHRVPISSLAVDAENDNWLVAEAVIPTTVGGWTVREIGLFDSHDRLIAVGNFPDTYKPTLEEGSGRDLLIRMIVQTSRAEQITLTIDPSVVVATVGSINTAIAAHEAKANPHPVYATDADLAGHIAAANPHPQYATDADLAGHIDATDPHPQYAKDTDLAGAMDGHLAADDPHPQYAKDADLAGVMSGHLADDDPHPQYINADELAAELTGQRGRSYYYGQL